MLLVKFIMATLLVVSTKNIDKHNVKENEEQQVFANKLCDKELKVFLCVPNSRKQIIATVMEIRFNNCDQTQKGIKCVETSLIVLL